MTKRIFKSTFFVAILVIILCSVLIMGVLYKNLENQTRSGIQRQALYVAQGVEFGELAYLEELRQSNHEGRVTWIDAKGNVLYDTVSDASTMENHKDREEIIEAFDKGYGESSRYSETMEEKTFYYARKLTDGTVVRVSGTQSSILSLIFGITKPLIVVIFIAVLFSGLLSARMARKIVAPLNELDLERPYDNDVYEEISPLLVKINRQNKVIDRQLKDLTKKQQEFAAITENMSEGFLLIDNNMDVLSHNNSALRLLGINEQPQCVSLLSWNRNESLQKAVALALEGQHNIQQMHNKGRECELMANPVYSEGLITGAVIVILDNTEKIQAELIRKEFTANVSHELKTPLTSISGYAETIKEGIAKVEDVPSYAGKIYDEAQRLIALVNEVLRLSQLDENVTIYETASVDLYQVAEKNLAYLEEAAAKKNLSVELEGAHCIVRGVPQIIEEIIYNLCDNAIKYNVEGGKVKVSLAEELDRVILTVSDTGIGIPKDQHSRVFERFYRVDKSHSGQIGGTGLGLSIVKHGVGYHGGTLALDSEPGKGTTITVTLRA